MNKEVDLIVSAFIASDPITLEKFIRSHVKEEFSSYRIIKRSIDSRQKEVKINLRLELFPQGENITALYAIKKYENVAQKKRVVIVGAGPAGLFAALKLIEYGFKPIIIERGKDVKSRRRDIAAIHKKHIVHPDSNYCFGEGGAGTYSDGKLYTRSTKRGDVKNILELLVQHGAAENILIEAHPHIGTNKLPQIIASIREQIIECGGEIHFNKKWSDFTMLHDHITTLVTEDGDQFEAEAYIMATGHSARDVYSMLDSKKILLEFKPFAIGVRAEHQQAFIDSVQYHCPIRPDYLPPAAYNLVEQVGAKAVYSFCMCPGGIIAPCATEQDEVVTNGWSPSKRNNPWANSGIVVPVAWSDVSKHHSHGALAGLHFQKEIEHQCWIAAGKTQSIPAQRMLDFVENKTSSSLPDCSYQPGIVSVNLNEILPSFIADTLRSGFKVFGKKMKGYLTNEAVVVAPESRTSSPVRIPRDKMLLHHPQLKNMYPCGEGGGFAGGIISAAIDGEKIAMAIANRKN